MKREYVTVLDGDGRFADEIVASCTASSRQAAERKMGLPSGGDHMHAVMTRRQAEARGIQDLRERTQFCR